MTSNLFLSRLMFNPLCGHVRRDLANCQDLHRTLLKAFPAQAASDTGARAEFGVLYRVETNPRTGAVTVLVQAQHKPDWSVLPADYLLAEAGEPKPIAEVYQALQPGQRLRFRLRANPTRAVTAFDAAGKIKKNSQRVDLRGEPEQLEWLRRKAQDGGFRLLALRVAPEVPNTQVQPAGKTLGWRVDVAGEHKRLTLAAVVFEGELAVTDAAQFLQTLRQGIGRGKAYGFGLLSIARAAV
ncbi:MAG: type I-E CRISPR-associated protein Cas6/Cse3/CasE [Acidobacteria bacterium]|nr:type I-E CRISPR-associated protein Cas6/Cse3/CasE [Acidobacteriota bacterium]